MGGLFRGGRNVCGICVKRAGMRGVLVLYGSGLWRSRIKYREGGGASYVHARGLI